MPARPRIAISGILAGGIPGFGIATFCLAPVGPSGDVFVLVLLLLQWMACSVRGTQAAWSLRFSPVVHDAFIPLFLVFVVFGWFVFVFCVWVLFGLFFFSGIASYSLALRLQEAGYSISFICSN